MEKFKKIVIGSSVSMLTDKQMKGLKGGTTYYCICHDESAGSFVASSCDGCVRICSTHGGIWSCNYVEGY